MNKNQLINKNPFGIKIRMKIRMKVRMKRMLIMLLPLFGMMLFCVACSKPNAGRLTAKKSAKATAAVNAAGHSEDDKEQSTADLPKMTERYYMVLKHDTANYQITLVELESLEQHFYEYTEGTEFFDKYGNYTLREGFSEGKLVKLERLNSNDTLGAIAFTDETWDYEDVINYSINPENNRMDIADTAYRFDTNVKVFSEGEQKELTAVGESDVLNVYGIGRTVYAIVIKTGHGTLALSNTELFEGGWVNLGTQVYAKVTRDMTMELPEGIYEFSVANDGYGDSGEIRIRRDKITTIDLNDYKGEGPKLCTVTFDVDVSGAILTVDGKKVNHKKPMELRYGVHMLGVYAQGYDAWTRQLVVNSPKANIEVLLSDNTQSESDSKQDDTDTKDTDTNKKEKRKSRAGSLAGSYAGGSSSGQTNGSNSSDSALANAALGSSLASIITGGESTDYLDTLSDLVDSLDKLKRSTTGSDSSENSN